MRSEKREASELRSEKRETRTKAKKWEAMSERQEVESKGETRSRSVSEEREAS